MKHFKETFQWTPVFKVGEKFTYKYIEWVVLEIGTDCYKCRCVGRKIIANIPKEEEKFMNPIKSE